MQAGDQITFTFHSKADCFEQCFLNPVMGYFSIPSKGHEMIYNYLLKNGICPLSIEEGKLSGVIYLNKKTTNKNGEAFFKFKLTVAKIGAFLGRGTFGAVFALGFDYVIKKPLIRDFKNCPSALPTNIIGSYHNITKGIRNPLGIIENMFLIDSNYLLMERCVTDLHKFLKNNPAPLEEMEFLKQITHIFHGVHLIHSRGYAYRDFKSANILVGKDGLWRISDFDFLTNQFPSHAEEVITGTELYVIKKDADRLSEMVKKELEKNTRDDTNTTQEVKEKFIYLLQSTDIASIGIICLEIIASTSGEPKNIQHEGSDEFPFIDRSSGVLTERGTRMLEAARKHYRQSLLNLFRQMIDPIEERQSAEAFLNYLQYLQNHPEKDLVFCPRKIELLGIPKVKGLTAFIRVNEKFIATKRNYPFSDILSIGKKDKKSFIIRTLKTVLSTLQRLHELGYAHNLVSHHGIMADEEGNCTLSVVSNISSTGASFDDLLEFRSHLNPSLLTHDFQMLLKHVFQERQSKGKITITKQILDMQQASDISSLAFVIFEILFERKVENSKLYLIADMHLKLPENVKNEIQRLRSWTLFPCHSLEVLDLSFELKKQYGKGLIYMLRKMISSFSMRPNTSNLLEELTLIEENPNTLFFYIPEGIATHLISSPVVAPLTPINRQNWFECPYPLESLSQLLNKKKDISLKIKVTITEQFLILLKGLLDLHRKGLFLERIEEDDFSVTEEGNLVFTNLNAFKKADSSIEEHMHIWGDTRSYLPLSDLVAFFRLVKRQEDVNFLDASIKLRQSLNLKSLSMVFLGVINKLSLPFKIKSSHVINEATDILFDKSDPRLPSIYSMPFFWERRIEYYIDPSTNRALTNSLKQTMVDVCGRSLIDLLLRVIHPLLTPPTHEEVIEQTTEIVNNHNKYLVPLKEEKKLSVFLNGHEGLIPCEKWKEGWLEITSYFVDVLTNSAQTGGSLSKQTVITQLENLLKGLFYIHSQGFFLQDISSENIAITQMNKWVFCDPHLLVDIDASYEDHRSLLLRAPMNAFHQDIVQLGSLIGKSKELCELRKVSQHRQLMNIRSLGLFFLSLMAERTEMNSFSNKNYGHFFQKKSFRMGAFFCKLELYFSNQEIEDSVAAVKKGNPIFDSPTETVVRKYGEPLLAFLTKMISNDAPLPLEEWLRLLQEAARKNSKID